MWKDLTLSQKAELMRLGVQSGITDLSSLKSTYNRYANGGYKAWKKAISAYKHLDIDNDRTYDYESYFNEDPQRAWDMMNKDSEEHFTDKYKTVYHPTFSNESIYSGRVHSKYNPQGEVGGRWTGNLGETYVPNRNSSMTQDQRIDRMLGEGPYDRPFWRKQHAEYGPILPELEVVGKSGKRFDDGGELLSEEDIRKMNWWKAPLEMVDDEDPLFKTLDVEGNDWFLMDKETGRLVPKSTVMNYVNSKNYREVGYQEQNDINDAAILAKRQADREVDAKSPGFWSFVGLPAIAATSPITAPIAAPIAATALTGYNIASMVNNYMDIRNYTFDKWLSAVERDNKALLNIPTAYKNLSKARNSVGMSARIMKAVWDPRVWAKHNIADAINGAALDYDNLKREQPDDISIYNDRISLGGTAQRTFLLNRNLQEEEFLKDSWIKGKKGDYGLVNAGVDGRDLPVWQTSPDVIDRESLTPIINLDNRWIATSDTGLPHPGNFPSAIYMDRNGKFYQKAWDLNDYGGSGGSTANIFGKALDAIGNPTVVTTGFQEINNDPVIDSIISNALYGDSVTKAKNGIRYVVPDIENILKANNGTKYLSNTEAYGGPLGNMFKGNGNKSNKLTFKSSPAIRERIANWEGASMYAPAPDTHKVNNSFENEDALFWSAVPDEVKPNLTQDMSDALYSLSYNIGAGNFKNRVSPVLVDLFKGKATVNDVMDSMYGTNDSKYRGLQRRRAWEKDEFKRAFNSNFGLPPYLPKQQETPEINPFLNVPEVTLDDIKPVQYVSDPAKQQELWTPNLEDDYNTTLPSFVLDLFTPSRQKKDTKKTTETPKSKYKGIKFDEGGEFNIDLPGITVYQPIQKEIPDFYKEAVREVGGKMANAWQIPGFYIREDAFDENGNLTDSGKSSAYTQYKWAEDPIEKSAYDLVLQGNNKLAVDAFGKFIPASEINSKAAELEHTWRMENDRAYRDRVNDTGATYEDYLNNVNSAPIVSNTNLDSALSWQSEQNNLDTQELQKRAADRFAHSQNKGIDELFGLPFIVAGGAAALPASFSALGSIVSAYPVETSVAGTLGGLAAFTGAMYGASEYDKYANYKANLEDLNTVIHTPYIQRALRDARRNPGKSRDIMSQLRTDWLMKDTNKYTNINDLPFMEGQSVGYNGTAQDAFLLDRDVQKQVFLSRGYKEAPGDYGLVKAAVDGRDIPVYQQMEDAITRDQLTPIGNLFNYDMFQKNTDEAWIADTPPLEHAGAYPTALYIGKDGNYYQKAWDLNDYSGGRQGIVGVELDLVGNPTVVTTGFQRVDPSKILALENNKSFKPTKEWKKVLKDLKERHKNK